MADCTLIEYRLELLPYKLSYLSVYLQRNSSFISFYKSFLLFDVPTVSRFVPVCFSFLGILCPLLYSNCFCTSWLGSFFAHWHFYELSSLFRKSTVSMWVAWSSPVSKTLQRWSRPKSATNWPLMWAQLPFVPSALCLMQSAIKITRSHRIIIAFISTEVVQEEGWKHEAQLHTQQRAARDGPGQDQRCEPQRGKIIEVHAGPCKLTHDPVSYIQLTSYICCIHFRAVTNSPGPRSVMVATSCVWTPFLSSPPKPPQRSWAMWAWTPPAVVLSFSQLEEKVLRFYKNKSSVITT